MVNKNILIVALVVVIVALGAFGVYQYGLNRTSTPAAPVMKDMTAKYVCPMHPESISDKPGKCSVCGMEMIKK